MIHSDRTPTNGLPRRPVVTWRTTRAVPGAVGHIAFFKISVARSKSITAIGCDFRIGYDTVRPINIYSFPGENAPAASR